MRSAVSIFDYFPAVAVPGPTPPERTSARALVARLRRASAARLAILIGMTLLVGIAISIITTTDPLWWHLHFSRLGTFKNGSAAFFNGALIVGGVLTVVYAGAAAREIRALAPGRVRRGAARTTRVMYSIMGVNLSLVGCVPLNSNGFVHDRVAGAMVLGFVGLLVTSPFLLHRMPRRLVLVTAFIFAGVFAGAWVFVTGQINLALFEVISFGAIFAWSGAFLACLTICNRQDAALSEASAVAEAVKTFATPAEIVPATRATVLAHAATDAVRDADAPALLAAPVAVVPPSVVGAASGSVTDAAATRSTSAPTAISAPAATTTTTAPRTAAATDPAGLDLAPVLALMSVPPVVAAAGDMPAAADDARVTTPTSEAPAASAPVRSERHAVPRRRSRTRRLGARHDVRAHPRRGCTESGARAASAPSRTPARR
jgi:hypothetical membrane protein